MKVLVIGSGGREHALCDCLSKTAEVCCAPGNGGISEEYRCFPEYKVEDITSLVSLAKSEGVDLVVVGPEVPLGLGLADSLLKEGIPVFGPQAAAAKLETSKRFAKEIMNAAGVVTGSYREFSSENEARDYLKSQTFPLVLKADGLAAGKGVVVCFSLNEALEALPRLFAIPETEGEGSLVIVEEFLEGIEASFIVATDGERVITLSTAHDYKRLNDNDEGPNTGGMGTVSPTPRLSSEVATRAVTEVIEPVLAELKRRDIPYVGFLYAGLMIDPSGRIQVLEFNARMGDPEGQVLLPRFEGDLAKTLLALAQKSDLPPYQFSDMASVSVVIAAPGYPEAPEKGAEIHGLELVKSMNTTKVYHAGTRRDDAGKFYVNGGRVLNVCGFGETVEKARESAYRAVDMIQFQGRQIRRDIGLK